ncbi:MAG: hypothetical protein AB2693_35050 [Candidatus Thiodiazotropha sp.]
MYESPTTALLLRFHYALGALAAFPLRFSYALGDLATLMTIYSTLLAIRVLYMQYFHDYFHYLLAL